jgi:hypothetical protein
MGRGGTMSAAWRAAARPGACTSFTATCRWNSSDISPTALSSESTAFNAPRLVGLCPLFLNMPGDPRPAERRVRTVKVHRRRLLIVAPSRLERGTLTASRVGFCL